jgi:tetratricopeptide (TPR) repeat protein
MKKYAPILLLLSIVLFFVTDHLKPGPSEEHDPSEHSEADHSDPENIKRMAIFHYNKGNKSLQQGNWEAAEKNYQKALIHNKEFQEAYINLSTTYFRAKKFDEALNALRELEKINPSNPLLHYNLACYYSLTKQPEASLGALKNALDLGYKKFQAIQTDPDLENLRKDADFKTWFESVQ